MGKKVREVAVLEFSQALGQLVRRIRAAATSHDLSLTELSVLGCLERHGPATAADLARAERIKPQSMSTIIAGLEERGLLGRSPHPSDGRQRLVELTARGAALRKNVSEAKRTWLAAAMTQLNEEERQTLFKAGDLMRRLVSQ